MSDYAPLHPTVAEGLWELMVEIDDYNSGEAVRELRLIQERGRDLFPDAKVLLIGSISQSRMTMSG
jgi:hypothetical protein